MTPTPQSSETLTPKAGVPFQYRGPIIAALILVLVVIFGGLYLWGRTMEQTPPPPQERTLPNNEPETPRAETDKHILDTVSTSKDLDAIYADLHSTNLGSLMGDLDTVLKELGALE